MKSKIILTSFVALGFACPAFATPNNTSATFPSDGYMLEDYTYTNAATYENLGAYEGPLAATAEYDNTLYNIPAGQYLAAASETGTQCPANSFCTGLTNATYDANNDQGITACSTLDNGAYPNSLAGAKANTDCYHACTTSDSNIAHAATFTGNKYYGGAGECALASCESGYHIKPEVFTADSSVETAIGQTTGTGEGAIDGTGIFVEDRASPYHGKSYYGISEVNEWAIDYGESGMLYGRAACSTRAGTDGGTFHSNPTQFVVLEDEVGETGAQYCYCKVSGYKPYDGVLQNKASAWFMFKDYNSASECSTWCSRKCSDELFYSWAGNQKAWRADLLGAIGTYSDPSCVSDTITINWSDASAEDIAANEAGTVTWGGDIRTPRAAATKPGKTFKGWKFTPAN